ncbi:hypothetical protein K501DRAFT_283073 [Backusella circina FSU 941]|nr:hypothetical protein K501DRAFT_283073 [Backusella circina FSU 941]
MLVGVLKTTHEYPELLNRVEQLTLHSYEADEKTWINLIETLPNVRDFYYIGGLYQVLTNNYIPKPPWCKNIERIIIDSSHRIVDNLLLNNLCPNLTDLNLYCNDNNFTRFLKNTPALETLTLCSEPVEYDDINKLHELVPNLKTLRLRDKLLMGEALNSHITPAYSITRLVLNLLEMPNLLMELELMHYIIKKYPNLVELIFDTYFITENNEEKETLHRIGWDPLLKNLAPTLRKLHISYTSKVQNLLETLDKHKCQIDNLKIENLTKMEFPNFAQSQQALYIRTLILCNVKFESLEWIKDMKVLETLEVRVNQYENPPHFDFNDIVDYAPPTLTSLAFTNVALTSKLISVKQSNIETLEFIMSRLSQDIVRFIDRHFPQLTDLTIKQCQHQIKTITLRSVELNSFYYVVGKYVNEVHALVRTLYDGEERLYSTRGEQHRTRYQSYYEDYNGIHHPPVKSQPADNIKIKPDISLCCYKVANVILHV